jgi:hypothetical protein
MIAARGAASRKGTLDHLRALRLRRQRIDAPPVTTAREMVAWLGAVQAQELGPAKWALALRSANLDEAAVDRELDEGRIVRTHILRPTWHFVAADDIRWMLSLSGPRVQAINAYYYKYAGVTPRLVTRAHAVFQRALEGGAALTRTELAARLAKARIAAAGQMLAHIVMHAELEGLVCSGPRRGRHSTYMLLDERVPAARVPARDDALAELARRYFTSHGPAKVRDFVWWSGMTARDTRTALEALAGEVVSETFDGETYWMARSPNVAPVAKSRRPGVVDLLPIYDEYLIAYRDRAAMLEPVEAGETPKHDIFAHYLMIDGRVRGTWRRRDAGDRIELALTPYRPLTRTQQRSARAAAARLARFAGRAVDVR